nr:MAG TPA: hypothetical protein [Caudoviricetes sp.]
MAKTINEFIICVRSLIIIFYGNHCFPHSLYCYILLYRLDYILTFSLFCFPYAYKVLAKP